MYPAMRTRQRGKRVLTKYYGCVMSRAVEGSQPTEIYVGYK